MGIEQKRFGEELRAWRLGQNPKVSQEELARRMRRSTQTISRWERGEHDVESDEDAAWIQQHTGLVPPRPVRSSVTKMNLSERISKLENEFSELRAAVIAALGERHEGVPVVLPHPDGILEGSDLEGALERAAPQRRDSPKRRKP